MSAPSPQFKARFAGVFSLLTFLTGGVAAFVGSRLVVSGDAAATATNIRAREALFQLGFTAYVLVLVCYLAVTLLFYDLFRVVNRNLSLFAAFFSLTGCGVQACACLFYLAPLALLAGAPYMNALNAEQSQALAYTSLKLYGYAYNIGLPFFAAKDLSVCG